MMKALTMRVPLEFYNKMCKIAAEKGITLFQAVKQLTEELEDKYESKRIQKNSSGRSKERKRKRTKGIGEIIEDIDE